MLSIIGVRFAQLILLFLVMICFYIEGEQRGARRGFDPVAACLAGVVFLAVCGLEAAVH